MPTTSLRPPYRFGPMGEPAGCRICHRPLSFHQRIAGQICDDWRCKSAILDRQMTAHREKAALACGINPPESYPMVVVPDGPLGGNGSPQFRVRKHVAFLQELVARTLSDGNPAVVPLLTAESACWAPPAAMASQVCAVCQGTCCHRGGDHAFLGESTIRRFMGVSGINDPLDIVSAYFICLPEQTAGNACVYQGTQGCTLPRWMRGDICNSYRCKGVVAAEALVKSQDIGRLYVVVRRDNRIIRSAFVTRDRIRHYPLS